MEALFGKTLNELTALAVELGLPKFTGKQMAEHRHRFMEEYLNEFYKEWNGEV